MCLHIVTEAYPKLEPSNPLAINENCWAASLVRLSDRELNTLFKSLSLASGVAFEGGKSS